MICRTTRSCASRKKSILIAVLLCLSFSFLFPPIGLLRTASASMLVNYDGGGLDTIVPVTGYPLSNFTDFNNGTTLTFVDYGNGTLDKISETYIEKTATLAVETDDSENSVSLPTSTESGPLHALSEETNYVNSTQTAMIEQQFLLGFTYELAKFRYTIIDVNVLVAYVRVGINVDIEFGLRLPLNVTLEYPDIMTVGRNYTCSAFVEPIDKPNFNESLFIVKARLWIDAGWWTPKWYDWGHFDYYYREYGPDYDLSKSFTTPIWPNIAWPIDPIYFKIFDTNWWDFDFLKIYVGFQPGFSSDKVTATASSTGDGVVVDGSSIRWTTPSERIPFVVHADDYDAATNYANISIWNLRYYFTNFYMRFSLKFDFTWWIDWLVGDPEIVLGTLDLSWFIRNYNLYAGAHPGYPNSIQADIYVRKYGVQILQISPTSANIVTGGNARFEISILNTGNGNDTFRVTLQNVPDDWEYGFSETSPQLAPGNTAKIYLLIMPPHGLSSGRFDFTVTFTSSAALLDDSNATDAKNIKVIVSLSPIPQIQILSPRNITYLADTIPLEFSVDQPIIWSGYSLDGEENVTVAGNTTLTKLAEGPHSVVVYANDSFGTMGESEQVWFLVLVPIHDVAVIDVTPSAYQAISGEVVEIDSVVRNKGTQPETFEVRAYGNNSTIGAQEVISLGAFETATLRFEWDTTGFPLGNYTLKTEASQVSQETNVDDNALTDGTVMISEWSPQKFTLTVNVTETDGSPISNATVCVDSETKTTDGGSVEFILQEGNYSVQAYKPGYSSAQINVSLYQDTPLVLVLRNKSLRHDVAVLEVIPTKTWVYQGRMVDINVTVANVGTYEELFNVTLYYNITENKQIGMMPITLDPGEIITLGFRWNTTLVPYCHNYIITATADIIVDYDFSNNIRESIIRVKVRIVGDTNGDGRVDIKDVSLAKVAFGSYPEDTRWNAAADVFEDNKISIRDIALIAQNFGKNCG